MIKSLLLRGLKVNVYVTAFIDDDGNEHKIECNERYYIPSEIYWLLKSLGFKKSIYSVLNLGLTQEVTSSSQKITKCLL